MTDLRTAAQQALEAMEALDAPPSGVVDHYELDRRKQALRAALAQQEAPKGGGNLPPPLQAEPVEEPVAWRHKGAGHFTVTPLVSKFPEWEPLYTTPPRREWKSLSEEDMEDLLPLYSDPSANTEMLEFAAAIEVKLKEKNA
jgi:hypothetical protein